MKFLLYAFLIPVILYNVYLGSFSARVGEVNFFNDVARDFLLLQELDQKKIVFIGPRSNTNGLFHGPLWTYINYPAYLIGDGNPVVVAWFWILFTVLFLVVSYFIAKKLFGIFPALVYTTLLSVKLIPHINGIFHAEATIFVMPLFFYTMYQYAASKKARYLVFHFITACAVTQFNIGVGIQFLMLSTGFALWIIIKNKAWKHLFSFFILPLGLINFILFDLKHQFQMTKALLSTGGSSKFFIPVSSWLQNRVDNIVSLQLAENAGQYQLFFFGIFLLVVFLSIKKIRNSKKERPFYILFWFYFLGYIVLSFFNKGVLLFHYIYLLIPLTLLLLISFLKGTYKVFFIPILLFIYVINFQNSLAYNNSLEHAFMGKNPTSWVGLSNVAKEIIERQKGKEFGYFVFAPDAYAYQPRYAMLYNFKKSHAKAFEYVKKPTTYVIAQPAPANDKDMNYLWWVKVPVKITTTPAKTKNFSNGYTILEYHLNAKEQKIPHDKSIELGIHFR